MDLDAAEMHARVVAQSFVVIAGNENEASALAYLAHQLLEYVVVRLRPMGTAPDLPEIDDVTDEIDDVGVAVPEEVEQPLGLCRPRAEVYVRDEQRSHAQSVGVVVCVGVPAVLHARKEADFRLQACDTAPGLWKESRVVAAGPAGQGAEAGTATKLAKSSARPPALQHFSGQRHGLQASHGTYPLTHSAPGRLCGRNGRHRRRTGNSRSSRKPRRSACPYPRAMWACAASSSMCSTGVRGLACLARSVGQCSPTAMQMAAVPDPLIHDLFAGDAPRKPWVQAVSSSHIWQAPLPAALPAGTHVLQVRVLDEYDREQIARTVIEVTARSASL